jgi:hypothetical protein
MRPEPGLLWLCEATRVQLRIDVGRRPGRDDVDVVTTAQPGAQFSHLTSPRLRNSVSPSAQAKPFIVHCELYASERMITFNRVHACG